MKITVETDLFADGKIFQEVHIEVEDRKQELMRFVLDTKEVQIREALIELGWTPPKPKTKAYCVERLTSEVL